MLATHCCTQNNTIHNRRTPTAHANKHDVPRQTISLSPGSFHKSTESAVLTVHNDIVSAIDKGYVVALALLDLSSAFDTVDHTLLLYILENRFSVIPRLHDEAGSTSWLVERSTSWLDELDIWSFEWCNIANIHEAARRASFIV